LDEEEEKYLKALAACKLFGQTGAGARAAEKVDTAEEALELAIDFEKDSVLFYVELQNFSRPEVRPVIQRIIGEERKHVMQLVDLKQFIKA
jgi:rubrerythrin